jgi:hypothetical protein
MVKTKTKKVYDFNMPKVKNQLVHVIKRRKNESTIADLVASSGLPKFQVEQAIKVVLDEYRGHLRVTESGELLYYFPHGMINQVQGFIPGLNRFFAAFFKGLGRVLAFLFKIWIVVMLVGYFFLFLAIFLAAVLGSIAISMGGKGRSSRGSKGGGFYLVIKLFELFARIWFYGQILKGPRMRERGRPLHKAVFAFVFGEPDPDREWETNEKKYVISFVQSHRGVLTLEEFMAITGRNSQDANELINRYLLEYEGEPRVTDDGTIIYFFPELLRTAESVSTQRAVSLTNPAHKQLIPFNYNKKSKNGWIGFFNGFNIFFGAYFSYFALLQPNLPFIVRNKVIVDFALVYRFLNDFLTGLVDNPPALIFIALGIIPVSFSFFFYLIPIIRNIRRRSQNERIKEENLRKKIYCSIHSNPMMVDPVGVRGMDEAEKPKNEAAFVDREIKRFAAEKHADVEAKQDGSYYYTMIELEREIRDVEAYRQSINLSDYAVGKKIFDSGE